MSLLLTAALAVSLAAPVGAATAPRMPIASFEQLARPLPLPYNESVDARAAFVDRHNEVLTADIGRYDANMDIPVAHGVTDKLRGGVPALLVVDPRNGKLLDGGPISAPEDARHMSPQGLADWLSQWTR